MNLLAIFILATFVSFHYNTYKNKMILATFKLATSASKNTETISADECFMSVGYILPVHVNAGEYIVVNLTT